MGKSIGPGHLEILDPVPVEHQNAYRSPIRTQFPVCGEFDVFTIRQAALDVLGIEAPTFVRRGDLRLVRT